MKHALATLRRDPKLRSLIEQVGSFELRSRRPYFWTLCRSILAQQVSGASARAVIRKVRALFPGRRFPGPESMLALPERALLGAGVSRQKRRYLYALADAFCDGGLSRVRFASLSDEQVMERLTDIVGIGRWTAEMFLMFSLRRNDVFPVGDLGIRRGMQQFIGVSGVPDMVRRAERWRPYRTVACFYLWRAQGGQGVKPAY